MNQKSGSGEDTILKARPKFELIHFQYIVIRKKFLFADKLN